MFKRMSPREMRRMMQRMGLEMEEMQGVEQVLIKVRNKQLVVENPQVLVMKMAGQTIFQIVGEAKEVEMLKTEEKIEEVEIPEEDIQLVATQPGVSFEEAKKALKQPKGDLAQAIMLLTVG
ncbi:MAG: nascent polypeptide-associated complex protein [Candidatus Methanomethylicota archaeon]|uniref:Nascent polypeptide-associated complex protein n=1 Tax=Thermoproteota archaeon TaxID=2056631 RepID=A0A497F0Y9_9CREN|nr:MAG: nascent polypeptide-associated complex protein [Candidatus Verstraetearchaeota archaeon]